jgi:hypothetical protein
LVMKLFFIRCYHEPPHKELVMKPFFYIWCYHELSRKELVMKPFFYIWCYHELSRKKVDNEALLLYMILQRTTR